MEVIVKEIGKKATVESFITGHVPTLLIELLRIKPKKSIKLILTLSCTNSEDIFHWVAYKQIEQPEIELPGIPIVSFYSSVENSHRVDSTLASNKNGAALLL